MAENDKPVAVSALKGEKKRDAEPVDTRSVSGSAYNGEQYIEYAIEPSPKDLLPTAAELAGFEQIRPGLADEMLKRVDDMIKHRHAIEIKELEVNRKELEINGKVLEINEKELEISEKALEVNEKALERASKAERLGQYLGFGVTTFAIAVIFVCVLLGKNSIATMIPPAIIAITGLAAVLLKK